METAIALLERALALQPELGFDPAAEAERVTIEAYIAETTTLLDDNRIRNALTGLNQIESTYPDLASDAFIELLTFFCSYNLADGFEEEA